LNIKSDLMAASDLATELKEAAVPSGQTTADVQGAILENVLFWKTPSPMWTAFLFLGS